MAMLEEYKISVRPLVEYVFRQGSIDSRFHPSSSMTDGTRAHQKIQKTYRECDQKEVPLKTSVKHKSLLFHIEGRCDGIIALPEGKMMIDEIKSTSGSLEGISEDSHPVHWAQAICYAFMFAKEKQLDQITVQLTYYQIAEEEIKQFKKTFLFDELEKFLGNIIEIYYPFAKLIINHRTLSIQSIKNINFPFDSFRQGQKKLAASVYASIRDDKELYVNAPTGVGKTISTLFPSIKAMGEGMVKRIFYLTAKTITRQAAEESLSLMIKKGLVLKAVTITAKEKVCFNDQTVCQKDLCPFADGYYDKVNSAILDIYEHENLMDRMTIEKYARKHSICPFEFSLDLAYIADVIICDYNYVFDPRVYLKRIADEQKKWSILLIDEAHNLIDRARGMFSAHLVKSAFLLIKKAYKGRNKPIYECSKKINQYFIDLRKKANKRGECILDGLPDALINHLEEFIEYAEGELAAGGNDSVLLDVYFSSLAFVKISKFYNDRYVTFAELDRNDVNLKLYCIDPSELLSKMGKGYKSKIYFSATLRPIDYFKEMLGAEETAYQFAIPSPFSSSQSEIFISPISTRYRDRERSISPISTIIRDLVSERPGNYFIFFPSYQYMKDVYELFVKENPFMDTIIQLGQMAEDERESFLKQFRTDREKPLIGFAVMGGIFSEGVDLKGDRLKGVVVVGTGLPQICLERNIIMDYFSSQGKNGYDYSYIYPGFNKVLQAGGRLIRSEQDTGTIVLIDDRFLEKRYLNLLPTEWKDFNII